MGRRQVVGLGVTLVAVALLASSCVLSGTWVATAPIDLTPTATTQFADVSCPTPSMCLAVGTDQTATNGLSSTPIIQRWDGATWTSVGLPAFPAGTLSATVEQVSCGTPTRCAVKVFTHDGTTLTSRFAIWNGTTWSSVPLVPTAGSDASLACIAGGCVFASTAGTVTWDGTAFTPNESWANPLALACTALDRCVGIARSQGTGFSWNGTTWTTTYPPAPEDKGAWYRGVACAAADNCLAVGFSQKTDHSGPTAPVAARWDGVGWTATPIPATTGGLYDVSCASASGCVATGDAPDPSRGINAATAFGWNGGEWYSAPAPPFGPTEYALYTAISCTTDEVCMAAGYKFSAGTYSTPVAATYTWTD